MFDEVAILFLFVFVSPNRCWENGAEAKEEEEERSATYLSCLMISSIIASEY